MSAKNITAIYWSAFVAYVGYDMHHLFGSFDLSTTPEQLMCRILMGILLVVTMIFIFMPEKGV